MVVSFLFIYEMLDLVSQFDDLNRSVNFRIFLIFNFQ